MSWVDDAANYAKGLVGKLGNFLDGGTITSILTTIATGYALYELQKSINKENEAAQKNSPTSTPPGPDYGVRLQVDADTKTKIPVVYGQAVVGGKLVDAVMTDANQTMWYAMVLSEVTGNTNVGLGAPSAFTFQDVYWNGQRIVFNAGDGITAQYTTDKNGKIDRTIAGLVKVYCYKNGGSAPVWIDGYSAGASVAAHTLFPNWDSTFTLNELVFVLVKVTYSKEKNVNGIGQMQFKISNSMNMPGDALYDYMTDTRYGAGIDPALIKAT